MTQTVTPIIPPTLAAGTPSAKRGFSAKRWTAAALAGLAFVGAGLGLSIAAESPAQAQRGPSAAALGWYGTYAYEELIPRGFGNNTITASVDYRLTVTNRGCRLDMEGLMTNTHIRCTARVSGPNLVIGFLSYTNGRVRNDNGVQVYRPGQTLFTLQRAGRGLTTRWAAISPDDQRVKNGRFFRKVR